MAISILPEWPMIIAIHWYCHKWPFIHCHLWPFIIAIYDLPCMAIIIAMYGHLSFARMAYYSIAISIARMAYYYWPVMAISIAMHGHSYCQDLLP